MPLPKKPIPFGEWRPDIALLDNQFVAIAENVYADANSYEPFPGLAPVVTDPLPGSGTPCGLTYARTSSGSYVLFAGTTTGLYKGSGAATWTDVSRFTTTPGDDPYNVADGDKWSFAQFGVYLVATHIGDAPQVINVDTGTKFAALGGSPPHATSVAVVGDFLVLSGLVANKRMIQWSAVNDITGWIIGTNLSDMQEFPDGGSVQGVAGGEIGYVLQDRTIRTMQFLPGDFTTIFSFSRVEREKGCVGKYGFVATRGILFLVAEDGFYALGAPNPAIGNEAVNHWFMSHSDIGRREQVFCFADPTHTRVMWAFYSSNTTTLYDRLIIFDWNLNRWVYATESAYIWGTLATAGFDLDTDVPGDPLDIPLDSIRPSLDSYVYQGGRPGIAGIDINRILGFLDGPSLAATLETVEVHLSPGMRTFISGAYPIIDAAPVTVAIGERERLQDATNWGNPQTVESTGSAAVFSSSRLHRFRVFVPAGTAWTHGQGVIAEAQPDGEGY